ncbi:MAG TPA: hypothetical protein VEK08_04905 [Planctomycetota bacterium]|nr:hypothetical protein [Planctomycetota bacterium]
MTLNEIIITDRLVFRNKRIADYRLEADALHTLAECSSNGADPLYKLVDIAARLTGAGSAGLSMLENTPRGEIFRWEHLTGRYREYTGGSMPRGNSPCGIALERNSPQLFHLPERFFDFAHRELGTIWVVAHDEETLFDMEDVRLMEALAKFVVHIRRPRIDRQ